MTWIIGGTIAVFLISMMDPSGAFQTQLMFSVEHILSGQVWRLFTWAFLPLSDNLILFALSLYFYYIIGTTLERDWGRAKLTLYYLSGILVHVIFGFALYFINQSLSLYTLFFNATDLNLSLFLAYAVLYPDNRILLFFFIPIKMWWLAAFDLAMYVYRIIREPFPLKLVPVLCILCFLIFCWDDFIGTIRRLLPVRRKATDWHKRAYRTEHPADFSNAVQNAESFSERKCAVCGKKASEHPEMEFRYCSRCVGLHCFCEEHINSHVHFTE
jgi:membrane associated rhomboid family serine protease